MEETTVKDLLKREGGFAEYSAGDIYTIIQFMMKNGWSYGDILSLDLNAFEIFYLMAIKSAKELGYYCSKLPGVTEELPPPKEISEETKKIFEEFSASIPKVSYSNRFSVDIGHTINVPEMVNKCLKFAEVPNFHINAGCDNSWQQPRRVVLGYISDDEWIVRTFFEKWFDLCRIQSAPIVSLFINKMDATGKLIASYKLENSWIEEISSIPLETENNIAEFFVTFRYTSATRVDENFVNKNVDLSDVDLEGERDNVSNQYTNG